jgi:WD40 repeat protein
VEIIGMAFIHNENYMLTMTEDGYMRIFDIKKMEEMSYLSASSQIFRSKKFLLAPNLKYIGMLTYKNQIKCWDLLTADHSEVLKSHFESLGTNKNIKLFRVTKKNKLICGYNDGTLSIYCLKTQKTLVDKKEPGTECINGLVVTKDEKHVIIGGKDKRYRIFEMDEVQTTLKLKHCSGPFVDSILEIAMFEDDKHFIVCVKGGIMQITNLETHQPVEIIHGDWWARKHNIFIVITRRV